jgi:UDP-2-acetamido-2-deoxy-ribo-hexuluronate aminotransferase
MSPITLSKSAYYSLSLPSQKSTMQPIQMVDTKGQYLKIKNEIDTAVINAIESAAYIGGPAVHEFAQNLQNYLGVKHVIPCANGTDALQIAFMALDLQPGDEVITPSFTYIATVEAAALLGIKPIFVEVDKDTFCIDPVAVENAIGPNTKAIVPVHLYGHSADMEPIMEIAKRYHLKVIEDTAQAIGAAYTFANGTTKKASTIGDIGCISFYPSKNLGAFGDGGAITTNDDELAVKLKMIASHGQSKKYYHDVVGCNSRLDTIQAAILNIKLAHLDAYNAARTLLADKYDAAFAEHDKITVPHRAANSKHAFHQYTLTLNFEENAAEIRNGLQNFLAEHKIPSMIYYPVASHKQKMFDAFGGSGFELPLTDWLNDRVISLPMHTEMDDAQVAYITSKVLEYINNK